jgi:hypothetical protein
MDTTTKKAMSSYLEEQLKGLSKEDRADIERSFEEDMTRRDRKARNMGSMSGVQKALLYGSILVIGGYSAIAGFQYSATCNNYEAMAPQSQQDYATSYITKWQRANPISKLGPRSLGERLAAEKFKNL